MNYCVSAYTCIVLTSTISFDGFETLSLLMCTKNIPKRIDNKLSHFIPIFFYKNCWYQHIVTCNTYTYCMQKINVTIVLSCWTVYFMYCIAITASTGCICLMWCNSINNHLFTLCLPVKTLRTKYKIHTADPASKWL